MRLRLAKFCEILGEERNTLRKHVARGEAPFRIEPAEEGKQRTYDGRDVFAGIVWLRLREAGLTPGEAGEAVLLARAADEYAEERSEPRRSELYLIRSAEFLEREQPYPSRVGIVSAEIGPPHVILTRMIKADERDGTQRGEAARWAGLGSVLAVPLRKCELDARAALRAHGYDLTDSLEIEERP
ncbi:MAG: hypothetical protein R6V44_15245 [Paracoccaceae bacterium]